MSPVHCPLHMIYYGDKIKKIDLFSHAIFTTLRQLFTPFCACIYTVSSLYNASPLKGNESPGSLITWLINKCAIRGQIDDIAQLVMASFLDEGDSEDAGTLPGILLKTEQKRAIRANFVELRSLHF